MKEGEKKRRKRFHQILPEVRKNRRKGMVITVKGLCLGGEKEVGERERERRAHNHFRGTRGVGPVQIMDLRGLSWRESAGL